VEAHETGPEWSVEIEIRGLSVYTRHGVTDAEQEVGQRLELDISLEVPAADAVLTDRVEDTIDYGVVCELAAEAATERSYRTLERLCQVIAERLAERFGCDTVSVRAAKPEPPIELPVQEVAVEVTQTPPPLEEDEELGEE
jgi:dihydroneopterin aldolase